MAHLCRGAAVTKSCMDNCFNCSELLSSTWETKEGVSDSIRRASSSTNVCLQANRVGIVPPRVSVGPSWCVCAGGAAVLAYLSLLGSRVAGTQWLVGWLLAQLWLP